HRLRRPLPDSSPGPEDADGRDAARARRHRARGQGPLRRLLELPRLPGGPGARSQRSAWARALRFGTAALQPALSPDRARAAAAGMSMAQMAVAWVLAHPAITSAIVGASRPDQLDDVLAAVDKELGGDLKVALDGLTLEYRFGDDPR